VPVAKKRVVLTILDGWGYRPQIENNAIALARKPVYDKLLAEYPNTLLHASDHFVGLPDGQMGNSEVGHLNIGAGRIVQMDITRIDALIASGAFYTHPTIVEAMQKARKTQLHLFGLLSDGGVHSHQEHLYALLKTAKQQGVEKVFVHAFMDGRDHRAHWRRGAIWRRSSRRCASSAASWPAYPAVTTRWIATAAGNAKRKPSTR